jgi:FkbM family methyltransferase
MVVVDVGANHGSLTSQYLQVDAVVFSVEPDPRCWRDLSRLVDAEHLIGVALGDTEGVQLLYRSKQAAHNSIALANVLDQDGLPALHVPLSTLDALQAQQRLPAHVDAIKIDTQGAEASILRGGTQLLRTQHPLLYVELWRDGLRAAGDSVEAIRRQLEPLGYRPSDVTWDSMVVQANRQEGHSSVDVLFLGPV